MSKYFVPWVEGERIPDEEIQDLYCQPPEVPSTFLRSAMIIGARGAGKTTLFRYQKSIHNGVALHISLATEFASLTKQTGFGPLAFDAPPELEPMLIGKATSILAAVISERVFNKGVKIPIANLNSCLPERFQFGRGRGDHLEDWLSQIKRRIAAAPIELFREVDATGSLQNLISAIGEASRKNKGPLLLLLDRADMVPSPSLVPVVELMDQSSQHVTLVAMRPGHAGRALSGACVNVVPGDHFSIVHLGTHPSSAKWEQFVEAAVRAQPQVGRNLDSIPYEIRRFLFAISRDSIRIALELSARYLSPRSDPCSANVTAALEDVRENLLTAAQRTLQQYHPDFRRWIRELRDEVSRSHGPIAGPVVLSIEPRPRKHLFDMPAELGRFVEVGLRNSALCMPEGHKWVPGLRITQVEIPPILVWRDKDPFWTRENAKPIDLSRKEAEVLKSQGPVTKSQSQAFVAYRMDFDESKAFRKAIQQSMNVHPEFTNWQVVDGQVPAGGTWPKHIRKRIGRAKIVIADVTGMRNDVLFELGFAYGLGKIAIPCVAKEEDRHMLQDWLGATQIGVFGDHNGLTAILASMVDHLSNPEFSKPNRSRKAVPSLAVFLKLSAWSRELAFQFDQTASREGLKSVLIGDDDREEESLERSASAAFLIATLDGSPSDALVHYVCGAIAARPQAGYGRTLEREIILIEKPGERRKSFIADSLRYSGIPKIVNQDQVRDLTSGFGKKYRRWSETPTSKRRRR